MTVCIAALYDNGQGCVMASDQMITAHFPIGYEFESDDVEKIVAVVDSVCVLIAGDVLFAHEVIERTKQELKKTGVSLVGEVAEVLRNSYQTIRMTHIIRSELQPRGLDINTYYNSHQRLMPQFVQLIDTAFKQYDPSVELIVAGKGESSYSIYTIINPGDTKCHDAIGYATIGSGSPHAIYSLIEEGYKRSLDKESVDTLVKRAKQRSEVAPGVGQKTTIIGSSV